jgi:CRISPR-associated endonuclease/helicase Cas3
LAHDLGKYRSAFQSYIGSATGLIGPDEDEYVDAAGLKGRIDHSTAGAQLIWRELERRGGYEHLTAQLIACAIASHHSGLIDCVSASGHPTFARRMVKPEESAGLLDSRARVDDDILKEILNLATQPELIAGVKGLLTDFTAVERRFANGDPGQLARMVGFKLGILQRLILSMLVDADRIDSANFESDWARRTRDSRKDPAWGELAERLETALGGLGAKPSRVNEIRADISSACFEAAQRPKGIYRLTVPTGGGKTLASLRFALHHAARHGLSRVIYVIPYTSILDQNADVARSVLEPRPEDRGRVVLEHHSNLIPEKRTGLNALLSENWDSPVVYTTSVQFLEALFGGGTSSVRRMHRLLNAVIVFDEIQTLPVRCVHLFNNAINFLVEHGGSTAVMCTATQPLLGGVDSAKGALRFAEQAEIVPDVAALFEDLKRVQVNDARRLQGWEHADIAKFAVEQTQSAGSCLVIVNTRRDARAIYDTLPSGGGFTCHLSTNMCPRHRREVIAQIRQRLALDQPVTCISTQLIEAGVDVDFGSVIRAVSGIDSIAQGAGRCNRNGLRPIGVVHVVNVRNENIGSLPDLVTAREQGRRVLDELAQEAVHGTSGSAELDPIGLHAVTRYFEYQFHRRADEMSYGIVTESGSDSLLNLLSTNAKGLAALRAQQYESGTDTVSAPLALNQAFATAAAHFKPIDTNTSGVLVPYDSEGAALVAALRAARTPAEVTPLLREATQFTISVFEPQLLRLREADAVEELGASLGVLVLKPEFYDPDFGLTQ